MQSVRARLTDQGISEQASDLIMASWRPATQKLYNVYISKWIDYAKSNDFPVDFPTISHIVNFLAHLFYSGLSYSTINSARSALSSYLPLINGCQVGCHPLVKRIMKGIFEKRPALPKYAYTWDVGQVLRYLASLPVSEELPLKLLTYRFVMLLCLLTAKRGVALHLLKLNDFFINSSKSMCQIVYSTKDKSTRPGFHTKPTIIQNYPDKKLCLVDHYVHYKQRTAKLRSSSTQELLITLQKPHNAISRATLSRWIKDVLQAAGIDISIFGAHSTRSASTSAALVGGASTETILNAAAWSSDLTFGVFYNKMVGESFSQAVYKAANL